MIWESITINTMIYLKPIMLSNATKCYALYQRMLK